MNKILGIVILMFTFGATGIYLIVKDQNNQTKSSGAQANYQIVETLELKGSNTVGESFAPMLARAYLKERGALLVETKQLADPVEKYVEGVIARENKLVRIDIRAHGSSTGFKALEANQAQIGMSSRKIKDKELELLSGKYGSLIEQPIALDALAIVTYQNNPIETLTIKQIAKLFSGEITNWSEIGGQDLPIHLNSRDDNSGTWDTFKSLVLKPFDKKLAQSSARFESSIELVNAVINTPGSLGFVGVAYVDQAKLLKVSESKEEEGSKPTGYTIGTEKYPLSRKLYFYTVGDKVDDLTESFISFVTQNSGQKLTEDVGLISYYPTHYRPETLSKSTAPRYRELAVLGRRITVDFAADKNRADIDKERRDIERLKNYVKQNSHRKIVLVDFAKSERLTNLEQTLRANEIDVLDTINIDDFARAESDIEVWVL
ncbi:MAG: PstS family phosphate ABC transporter substrate-binding protein [Kangiellaceae bacterium]|nr:PstS family phosphate ABC transporter substrate-binding protein [Kangiellaceae bacterium]